MPCVSRTLISMAIRASNSRPTASTVKGLRRKASIPTNSSMRAQIRQAVSDRRVSGPAAWVPRTLSRNGVPCQPFWLDWLTARDAFIAQEVGAAIKA